MESVCKKCHQSKPLEKFPKCAQARNGRAGRCYSCAHRARYYANIAVSRAKQRHKTQNFITNSNDLYCKGKREENSKYRGAVRRLRSDLTEEQWSQIKAFYNYCCAYCGEPAAELVHNRIIPVSKGGEYTARNVAPACITCSTSKQDKLFEPAVMHPVRSLGTWGHHQP